MARFTDGDAPKRARTALWVTLVALIAVGSLIVLGPTASAQVEPYSDESPTVLGTTLGALPEDEVSDAGDDGDDDQVLGKRVRKNKGGNGGGGGGGDDDTDLPPLEEVAADDEEQGFWDGPVWAFGGLILFLMLLFLMMAKRRRDEEEEGEQPV